MTLAASSRHRAVPGPDRDHRRRLSARGHRHRPGGVPQPGRRQPHRQGRQARRLAPDRPELQRSEVLLEPPLGHLAAAVQRPGLRRLEPGPAQPGADRRRQVAHRRAARRRSEQQRARSGRSGHRLGQRPGSGHQPRRRALPGSPRGPRRGALQPEAVRALDRGSCPGQMAGYARRAPRQCAGAESGAGRA